MDKWHIYFWEPVVSPHKMDLFNALSQQEAVEGATYVSQEEMFASRRAEGWMVPDYSHQNVIIAPSPAQVREIMASSPKNSVHLFSGIHWVPCIVEGIAAAIAMERHFGIMTEPRAREGWKGAARLIHSWVTEGVTRRHADFILAIGRNGPPWFRATGYPAARIFPFAYFIPPIALVADHPSRKVPTQVTWLARTIIDKGIDLFLDAIPRLSHPVTVEAAGAGDQANRVAHAALKSRVPFVYHGPIPMGSVAELLARTDILVLPSITTNDGWGAVVGEGLMAGAAVVAGDRVGASICLNEPWRGRVVGELTGQALAKAIDDIIDRGQLDAAGRAQRSAWAHSHLTGQAGAEYLLRVLSHVYDASPRPTPFYMD